MDRPTGGSRSADSPSSFFAQRSANGDGYSRPSATPDPLRGSGGSLPGQADRLQEAKRFEDEKRGISESLFGKQDETGKPYQNYITHIKVLENAAYPTSPPPLEYSTPEHNKERFIILSVKASGRVWMHKARHNPDGTFQIGKSWPMEELQSIETFTPTLARTEDERERAERAGSLGFVITMAKPYYWRAEKILEKGHFIQSIIRVYTKFTGNIPTLIGFTPKERERIVSAVQAMSPAVPQPRRDQQPAPLAIPDRMTQPARRPSDQSSTDARSASVASAHNQRPLSRGIQQKPGNMDNQYPSPQPLSGQWQQNQSMGQQLRSQPSREFSSQHSKQQEPAPEMPLNHARNNFSNPQNQPSRPHPTEHLQSNGQDTVTQETTPLASSTASRWRPDAVPPKFPNGVAEATEQPRLSSDTVSSLASHTASVDSRQLLPERRRPPLPDQSSQRSIPVVSTRTPPMPSNNVQQQPNDNSRPSTAGKPAVDAPPHRFANAYTPSTTNSTLPQQPPLGVTEETTSPSSFQDELDAAARPAALNPGPLRPDQNAHQDNVRPVETPAASRYRPGLGPMMGSKADLALKPTATVSVKGGFKPRAGGAGERLLRRQASGEAETVSKAVPPLASKTDVRDEVTTPITPVNDEPVSPTQPSEPVQKAPQMPAPLVTQNLESATIEKPPQEDRSVSVETTRKRDSTTIRARSNVVAKSLAALNIDPYILGDRELDYDLILNDFGWEQNMLDSKQVDALQAGLRREIARLEAGSWSAGHPEQKDGRIVQVGRLLDQAISECDTMDSLLRLYSVELSTLNDDIAYIEAQSQGLQVQTANQKLLQTELQKMVSTISIGQKQLEPLKRASLQDLRGLAEIEAGLLMLYQALLTIDPSIVHGDLAIATIEESPARLTNMRALQEKKDFYLHEAHSFLLRLRNYADPTFGMAFQRTKETMRKGKGPSDSLLTLDLSAHDAGRSQLWPYSPLMLFAKTIDTGAWQDLILAYIERARALYQDEFRDNQMQWKKAARKVSLDEQEALFTHQKEEIGDTNSGLGSAARKLTVKRSQTLAKTLGRGGALDKRAILEKPQDSRLSPAESFGAALDEAVPIIFAEQNFIVDFFHASSQDVGDFDDAVRLLRPSERQGTDLLAKKIPEVDRTAAKRVLDAMEGVFATWFADMQGLVDWTTAADPFQAVGVLCALERKRLELEDSDQAFIMTVLQRLTERLNVAFTKFVDSQIRAIEEMKVKVNKRKGVHSIVRVFPNFTAIVESMVPPADGQEQLELRAMIDEAYARISRAIFDGLRAIAKTTPSGAGYGASADPEDKEALNYHILLIENMYHFYTEVEERGDAVLGEWRGKAMMAMAEHQEHYVSAVIRRPLGKLLDFVESMDAMSASAGNHAMSHSSHSRSAFKKALGSYDGKEIRRGIETLRRRIEKHFGEGDDYGSNQKLVANITGECERKYLEVLDRVHRLAAENYENTVNVEFGKEDIAQGFRR